MTEFEQLFETLKKHNTTVGFAESCTGGLLSSEMARMPGISAHFIGSAVSYANSAKSELLGVSADLINQHGAVSTEVAMAMASGLRDRLRIDWTIAITGIAGPSGGTPDKPVGTVCFGIVGPELESSEKTRFDGNRWDIQNTSARYAAQILTNAIGSSYS